MKAPVITTMLAVTAHCGGCAGIFQSRGPLLDELRNDQVHLEKRKSTVDSDVYLATYMVDTPVEDAWTACQDVMAWLQDTELFANITPGPPSDAGTRGDRYLVELPNAVAAYPIGIVIDDPKRMIDIIADDDTQGTDQVTHLNITMQSFFEGSTLVTAELSVTSDFLSGVKGIARLPEFLFTGRALDKWLYDFGNQLAEVHRDRARARTDHDRPLDLVRVHVIAIGLNAPNDHAAIAALNVSALAYAEADASSFYRWATTRFPWPPGDDSVIRQRLVGPEATAANVQKVLNELKEGCLGNTVREGDTVLFFFSGQIVPLRNEQARFGLNSRVPHLLTVDFNPSQVALTAIPRSALLTALRLSRASRCLLFVDSCFGGGYRVNSEAELQAPAGTAPPSDFVNQIGPSTVLFAADWENQQCAEDPKVQHGLFTGALLEGLEIPDVSANELDAFIASRVRAETGAWQQPLFYFRDGYSVDTPIFGDVLAAP